MQACLRQDLHPKLQELRDQELRDLRGEKIIKNEETGQMEVQIDMGERQPLDRIYDYQVYCRAALIIICIVVSYSLHRLLLVSGCTAEAGAAQELFLCSALEMAASNCKQKSGCDSSTVWQYLCCQANTPIICRTVGIDSFLALGCMGIAQHPAT